MGDSKTNDVEKGDIGDESSGDLVSYTDNKYKHVMDKYKPIMDEVE